MPLDFIHYVESGVNHLDSNDWLTPVSVHGLIDADFITLPPGQREELFRRAEQFRLIAEIAPNVDGAQRATAREALVAIWELLKPYRTPESTSIRDVLWRVWTDERVQSWTSTFDYRLGEDWSGDLAIWVWLILNDDVDVEAPATREALSRFRQLTHARLQDAGITRWPYISVRSQSEVKEAAGVSV